MNDNTLILTLDNGCRFAYLHQRDSDVSYVGVAIHAGTKDETDNESGLAHFVEHTVFKGTEHFSAKQINTEVERLGGDLNAFTTKETTVFHATVLNQGVNNALRVLVELTNHPTFPEDELRKEANVIVDEIQALNDSPDERIYEDLEAMIFGSSPMGRKILGDESSVRKFGRNDALRWVRTHFTPSNMSFFAFTSLPAEQLTDYLNSLLGKGKETSTAEREDTNPSFAVTEASKQSVNMNTHQAYLAMGGRTVGRLHEDFVPIALATNMLGGPAISSWLYTALREEQGLAYSVDASYTAYSDTGCLIIVTSTEPKFVNRCRKIIHQQLLRLQSVTQTELDAAKLQIKGQIAIADDNKENIALGMVKSALLFNKHFTRDEIWQAIDRITVKDIHSVATRYFNPDNLHELLYK